METKKRVNNIIRIPTSLDGNFFKFWLGFLLPFHHLTNREIDIAAAFLKERYALSKVIKDVNLLDKILMNEDTKAKIRKECDVTTPHFQVIMGKLRKAQFIIDGKINSKFIPKDIEDNDSAFKVLFYFDFDADKPRQTL